MSELRFLHLGVAVPSLESALSTCRDVFGYRILDGPYEDAVQRVSICFVGNGRPGEVTLELVAPLGEDSPVRQFLNKEISTYHLCFEAEDLDQRLIEFRGKGCLVVAKPVPAVAFQGRRITWLYTPTRQLFELVEK